MRLAIDLTALILSAICVAETDGNPMTARDIAFLLDIPQEEVEPSLNELIEDGSISQEGDLYRYDLRRPLTATEVARIEHLDDQIQQLRPLLDKIPERLDN